MEAHEKSLKIVERLAHPFYDLYRRQSLLYLSEAYTNLGNHEKVKEALKACLQIEGKQKSVGRKLTKSAPTLRELWEVYSKQGYQRHDVEFLENNLADEIRLCHRLEFTEDLVLSYKILGRAYGAFGDKAKEREMKEAAAGIEKGQKKGSSGNDGNCVIT